MTAIDFYVLAGQGQRDQLHFTCRILEKALAKNNQVLLYTSGKEQAEKLDQLLWTAMPESFIPHALIGAADAPKQCPVHIGWENDPGQHHDILINLSNEMPPFYSRFQRYIGIVVQHDKVLNYTREHYRFLKERGYHINTHDMRIR